MTLSAFLRRTGATLRARWPSSVWVQCAVIGCKPARGGSALELVDAGPGQAEVGQLRAFLPDHALPVLRAEAGRAFEPSQLVGMAATLRLAPEFHVRWHIQARVDGIAHAMGDGLGRRMRHDARAALVADGTYDRQRRLPAPPDVTRLSVVHPVGGAGHADVERELRPWQAAGLVAVRSCPAPFEGVAASAALPAALRAAAEPLRGFPPDAIHLVRGGGPKSGLQQLDEEALARAIAALPIPLIAGLGHAGDLSLADEVAWRSADTPSKAVAIVRSLIAEPARRAMAGHRAAGLLARERAARASSDLERERQRAVAAGECLAAARGARLAAAWSAVRTGAAASRGRCSLLNGAADAALGGVAGAARLLVEGAGRSAAARADAVAFSALARLESADSGDALLEAAHARAAARLDPLRVLADRCLEDASRRAGALVDGCAAALEGASGLLDGFDPGAVVGRGFALVLDADGRAVIDKARAQASSRLWIRFRDGDLAVSVEGADARGADHDGSFR